MSSRCSKCVVLDVCDKVRVCGVQYNDIIIQPVCVLVQGYLGNYGVRRYSRASLVRISKFKTQCDKFPGGPKVWHSVSVWDIFCTQLKLN